MKKILWACMLGFVFLPFFTVLPAGAVHPLDEEINAAMDADPTTRGMIEAAGKGTALWRQELDRQYENLVSLLPEEGVGLLEEAQECWTIWVERELALQSLVYHHIYDSLDGGTMWLLIGAVADMEVYRNRALQLMAYDKVLQGEDLFRALYPEGEREDFLLPPGETVENTYLRLGELLGEEGEDKARRSYQSWLAFRELEIAFRGGLSNDESRESLLRQGLFLDGERYGRLTTLLEDLIRECYSSSSGDSL